MIRDIALMANVPGLIAVEPSCEAELTAIVDHILGEQPDSVYLRLVSILYSRKFPEPKDSRVRVGHGAVLREGRRAAIVIYGPVLLNEAWQAAERLVAKGEDIAVINMPWLNRFDPKWLQSLDRWPLIVVADNHATTGGLGDNLAAALATQRSVWHGQFVKVGVKGIAACGGNDETLHHHGLSAAKLAEMLQAHLIRDPAVLS